MRNLKAPVPSLEESTRENRSENHSELPLCILGPGGDYQQTWPVIRRNAARNAVSDATALELEAEGRSAAFGWGWVMRWLPGLLRSLRIKPATRRGRVGPLGRVLRVSSSLATGDIDRAVAVSAAAPDLKVHRDAPILCSTRPTPTDIQAGGYPDHHPRVSKEPWLFADDAGNRRPNSRHKGHGVRARRNLRRKGPVAPPSAQGTLFGADLACGVAR